MRHGAAEIGWKFAAVSANQVSWFDEMALVHGGHALPLRASSPPAESARTSADRSTAVCRTARCHDGECRFRAAAIRACRHLEPIAISADLNESSAGGPQRTRAASARGASHSVSAADCGSHGIGPVAVPPDRTVRSASGPSEEIAATSRASCSVQP
jgi:hypothetical protein